MDLVSSSHSGRKEDRVSESYQAVADLLQSDLQDRFRWWMHACMKGNRGVIRVCHVRANVVFVPYHVDNIFPSVCEDLITSISGLADIEWNVAIFDHVLDLSSHYPQVSNRIKFSDT